MNFGMIVATQRSGTNALRSILRKAAGVVDLQEVLSSSTRDGLLSQLTREIRNNESFTYGTKDMTRVFDDYFQRIIPPTSSQAQLLLLDCKYNAFGPLNPGGWSPCRIPYFLNYCGKKKFKFLHLVRENVFATYISTLRVRATGEWHWPTESSVQRHEEVPVEIKLSTLKEELMRRLEEIALFRRHLGTFPSAMEITYESLLHPDTLQSIGNFFQVTLTDLEPTYERIVGNARKLIVNYEEAEQLILNDPDLEPVLRHHMGNRV